MKTRRSIEKTFAIPAALVAAGLSTASIAQVRHPLDALTAEEIESAVALVEAGEAADVPRRYPLVHLLEPAKKKVLAWTVGQEVPRAAFVTQRRGATALEAVVDLNAGKLMERREVRSGAAGLLAREIFSLTELVLEDPRMGAALAARQVEDPSEVRCLPVAVLPPAGSTSRKVRALCWDGRELNNFFSRPLGGLEILIDLDERRVVGFRDHGPLPLATANHAYDEATMGTRRRLAPIVQEQPAGGNFTLDGGSVRWQNWGFHTRFDPRRGPVVSQVYYWDRGRRRSVLYQGSLADIFVPYRLEADGSSIGWTAAQWGLRPSPLAVGFDCPKNATLLDVVVADDHGRPKRVKKALAIFERRTGNPVWRRYDALVTGQVESRPAVELVVRSIVGLGTYDHLLDWVFTQEGGLRVEVGVTGVMLNEGVRTVFLSEPTAGADTSSGSLMAANIVAPHHRHRLTFRLDVDVDGTVNSFEREKLEPVLPEGGGLGILKSVRELARRESQARLGPGAQGANRWRVVGTSRKTDVGHVPGFTLEAPSGRWELRVSPYDENEILAPQEGGDRSIERTDLVLWYEMEIDHVPRLEDFPVMPTHFRRFELRPVNFFEKNPAVDLRTGFASSRR